MSGIPTASALHSAAVAARCERLAGNEGRTGQVVVVGWRRQGELQKERYRSNLQALLVTVTGNAQRHPNAVWFRAAGSRNLQELREPPTGTTPSRSSSAV